MPPLTAALLLYLAAVNVVAFAVYGADKRRAKKDKRRVPEKTLFLLAIIGGSVGAWAGMYTFRHKTKHLQFTLGMPAILIVQLILAFVFYTQFYPLR